RKDSHCCTQGERPMHQLPELDRLVTRGYETKDVEYKGPMIWDESDKKACCELVKDILAIANTQGGVIVIGVREDNGQFLPVGLSPQELSSYESTRLANFVQRYADPPINVTARQLQSNGLTFVAIQVPRFPR